QACAGGGYDCNSFGGNDYSSTYPGFVSLPNGTVGSGNWHLLASSPAAEAGANLTEIFTASKLPTNNLNNGITDISQVITRPAPIVLTTGSPTGWSIGAYEGKRPSSPFNLH
ncbi:MAG: hypothetical protein M0Z52_01735, partial [Actinomycetota bacterium]|nr:hypothetical protein [Actinomycetota bacterium]